MHAIRGYLTPDAAAQLQLILDAILNPKGDGPPMPGVFFAPTGAPGADTDSSDTDSSPAGAGAGAGAGSGVDADAERGRDPEETDPFNSDPRSVLDDRTAAQKRHDALTAALGIAARHKDMPTLGGASPVVVVTVDANDLATHATHATGAAFGGAAFGGAGAASGASGNGGWAATPVPVLMFPSPSRRRSHARGRSSACSWTRGGSSGSRPRIGSSPCTSVGRSSPATRSA